ncbi:hypothetical protein [Streptomyces sp. H27-S2]|uniref:hypothetical protein n=1 Tax=Streptomyces antarcticus TaxID=2996458 RepID=UPI00226D9CDD|nr:hypothetical protein [Streptomyces sp. H27-S2]MCY0948312.1 hypothetical protein [Streptomyces sp. H27-S2]
MEIFERARLDAYFSKIAAQFVPDEPVASFLITHLLPERPAFVRAVAAMSCLKAVLPKPKSISPAAQRVVEQAVPVDALTRELFTDPDTFRFLFRTTADIGELQTEEVSDAAWHEIDEVTAPQLRQRIADALR